MAILLDFQRLYLLACVVSCSYVKSPFADCFCVARWLGRSSEQTRIDPLAGVARGSSSDARKALFSEDVNRGRKPTRATPGRRPAPRSGPGKSPNRAYSDHREVPWWMAEKEKNNPKILPPYQPWWLSREVRLPNDISDAQLRTECSRRGVANSTREEMIRGIAAWNKRCDLSDKGFVTPVFDRANISAIPTCYPEAYESPDVLMKIRDHVNKYKST